MPSPLAIAGQALAFLATAAALGVGSQWPVPSAEQPAAAYVTVSFVHGGARENCRQRSEAELGRLAPNMRRVLECSRERSPVHIDVALDGATVLRRRLEPAGLSKDGPSRLYARFRTDPGVHRLALRLGEHREEAYDHAGEFQVTLRPGQNLLVDFVPERGGFILR